MAVWPTADGAGTPGQRRKAGLTNQIPATTSTTRGTSLATATASTSRAPTVTPRTFTAASTAKSAAMTIVRAAAVAVAGQRTATDPANALATEDTANVAIRK